MYCIHLSFIHSGWMPDAAKIMKGIKRHKIQVVLKILIEDSNMFSGPSICKNEKLFSILSQYHYDHTMTTLMVKCHVGTKKILGELLKT